MTFDDGVVGDVAFEDHEWRGVLAPLGDPARFDEVGIEMGTLCWPSGLDMAPERRTARLGRIGSRIRPLEGEPLYAEARANPVGAPATGR